MREKIQFYNIDSKQTIESLGTSLNGLDNEEVKIRLAKFGYNKLPEGKKFSVINIFIGQFKNPLIYILLVAILISFLSDHSTDAWIILFVTSISVVVGFFQEYKANNALSHLKSLIKYKAKVIRANKESIIEQEFLVPGDLIILSPGDKVPADARLIETQNFEVIESALTGESLPIEKNIDIINGNTTIADRKNMVYLGTVVSRGIAKAVVTHTGVDTEIGHIAKLVHEVEEGKTPLQKQILQFGKIIGMFIIILNIIIFGLGILSGKPRLEMFLTSISMVVAAVPEGLLPAMTIILAVSMQKLAKQKGLIRKMLATETLGAVSVICSDKTGTLTKGEMRVVEIITDTNSISHDGKNFSEKIEFKNNSTITKTLKICLLCNDALVENIYEDIENWKIIGNPTEKALLLVGYSSGLKKDFLEKEFPRIGTIPFESQHKYMVTRHIISNNEVVDYIKGAPEKILPLIDYIDVDGKIEKLTVQKKKQIEDQQDKLTSKGLRVIAVAYRKEDGKKSELKKEDLRNFIFVGLVALKDPLRTEVKNAIHLCQNAGMQLKVITGDHKLTTMAIVRDLGISVSEKNIFEGYQLDEVSDDELNKIIKDIVVFARVEPRHKIRIVSALQSHGKIVAMTGDGVNDAPALKKADIGVAVGSGTDVAKETADLILLDDSFYTIVEAVRRGRGTFENIRKVILYLLSNSFKEVTLISLSLIFGLPLALLPVQILRIKMIEDSLPSIALAFDPIPKDIMDKPPRESNEQILNNKMKKLLLFVIGFCDILLFGIFYFFRKSSGDINYAQTIAFVGLGIASRFYVFSIRNLNKPIRSYSLFENKFVNRSTLFGIVMIVLAVYVPFFNSILHTVPLGVNEWVILFGYGLFSMGIYEIGKKLFMRK